MNRDRTLSFKKSFETRDIIIISYSKCPFVNFIYQVIRLTLTVNPYYRAIVKLG